MTRKNKTIPRFERPEQEQEYWDQTDATEHMGAEVELEVDLKRPVTVRLEPALIEGLKAVARRRHVPYQTMLRQWLWERLEREQAKTEGK